MKPRHLFPLITAALVLLPLLFPTGCANTTTPPSGGPKDTIPPVLVKVAPFPGTTGVDPHSTKLVFTFNEYVKIKEANNIYLSPPLEKKPKTSIQGKSLVVTFESDLDTATTYTLDLTGALVDNNEGNPFPGFTLVFSTGSRIDSMCVTGIVQDCNTLLPVTGATVLLYKDQADSAVFLQRPVAAARTDDWGFFGVRNIQDTVYRVYAIKDENNNNRYDPETERIAFVDSLFRPTLQFSDSLYEFMKFDMKDTALCLARKTELELNLFREKPTKQFIVKKERVGERAAYLTFMAPDAQINKLEIKGYPQEKVISQFNLERDSLEIWVNDPRKMPDTLHLSINYNKTDSLGVLQPTDEDIKLFLSREARAELMKKQMDTRNRKHEDTVAVMKVVAEAAVADQFGYDITFGFPLTEARWDTLKLRSVNPRQQTSDAELTVVHDSTNLRHFNVMPVQPFQQGYDYILSIPERIFRDINGFYNDSSQVKITLPTDEKLSSIGLNITGVKNKYFIELLGEKRDKVIRSFIIDQDASLLFPYLKAGNYCIRVTEDINRNNRVDTGNLLEKRQPEKVRFFKPGGDQFLIKVMEKAEMLWDLNMEELFK